MSSPDRPPPHRYCGRLFTAEELDRIRRLIASEPRRNRAELSRRVCDELAWVRPDGRRKDMSCRLAMLRMHRHGLITLPPPEKANGNGRRRPRLTCASAPRAHLCVPAGALGFGAAAWALAPRDRFIGWSPEQRRANLHLVVNNARFLIFPWVDSHNLASRLLGRVASRLRQDWHTTYGYRPVLIETFVERTRFRGTCYRAANWTHVGQTQGRGKLDRHNRRPLPVKDIFLYPLHKHFRQRLRTPQHPPPTTRLH